jgi:hypothetical protein
VKLADGLSPDKKTIVDIFHGEVAMDLGSLITDVNIVDKIFLILCLIVLKTGSTLLYR